MTSRYMLAHTIGWSEKHFFGVNVLKVALWYQKPYTKFEVDLRGVKDPRKNVDVQDRQKPRAGSDRFSKPEAIRIPD